MPVRKAIQKPEKKPVRKPQKKPLKQKPVGTHIACPDCGSRIRRDNRARHVQTKKHQRNAAKSQAAREFADYSTTQLKQMRRQLKKSMREERSTMTAHKKLLKSHNKVVEYVRWTTPREIVVRFPNLYLRLNPEKYSETDRQPWLSKPIEEPMRVSPKDQAAAIQRFIDSMRDDYSAVEYMFDEVEPEVIEQPQLDAVANEKIPMKSGGLLLHRDWLKYGAGISKTSYDDYNGECVIQLLLQHLKPTWKRASESRLLDIFVKAMQHLDNRTVDHAHFREHGVDSRCIRYLCEKKDITLIALGSDSRAFLRRSSKSRHHRPVVYYCMDEHMYLIDNQSVYQTISKSERARQSNTAGRVAGDLLQMEKPKKENTETVYRMASSLEDAIQRDAAGEYPKTGDVLVYLPADTNDLTMQLVEAMVTHKKEWQSLGSGCAITTVVLRKGEGSSLRVCIDPSPETGNWQMTRQLASELGIEFKNQQISSLLSEFETSFTKNYRPIISSEVKIQVLREQNKKCNVCHDYLQKGEMELDHINPVCVAGGSGRSNLQYLCRTCHVDKTSSERLNAMFTSVESIGSSFNSETRDVLLSDSARAWAFVEEVKSPEKNEVVQRVDMNKCRRNLVLHSKHAFPKYSVTDAPAKFSGKIQCGYFYVTSQNRFPLRGNGWYTEPEVELALEEELISLADIHYELLPTTVLPPDFFVPLFTRIIDACDKVDPSEKLSKLSINALIGIWGTRSEVMSYMNMSLDRFLAGTRQALGDTVTAHEQDGTPYYLMRSQHKVIKETWCLPIYHRIVAAEACALYRIEKEIRAAGCKIVDRYTDAVGFVGKFDHSHLYWDDDWTCPMLKLETKQWSMMQHERLPRLCRTDEFKLDLNRPWVTVADPGNDDFEAFATELLKKKTSFNLQGRAGTGKTHLLREILKQIPSEEVVKLAPTHAAARLIGGQTIHSYYVQMKLSQISRSTAQRRLGSVKWVIVDEISMVTRSFYRLFVSLQKLSPQIRFILSGDFDQLPAIEAIPFDYRNSSVLHQLCDGTRVELSRCRRADDTLFNLCRRVNDVDPSEYPTPDELPKRHIAFTHKKRIEINELCMDEFCEGDAIEVPVPPTVSRVHHCQPVRLCAGMPVISYRNNRTLGICNTDEMRIVSVGTETMKLMNTATDGEVTIPTAKFHSYFKIGYCITVHVSQGKSFNSPFTIHEWSRLSDAGKYVALSRATDINLISIA